MPQTVTNPPHFLLDIELVCRKVHLDARRARSRVWPRTVSLESSRHQDVVSQLPSRKYAWLQNHIDTLKVDTMILLGQSSLLFPVLLNSFPHLRHLEFDEVRQSNLNDHVLTFRSSEELQKMTKNGSLIYAHRTCIGRHNVQGLVNRMAQKFGSEYSIRGNSHIMWLAGVDGGNHAGWCATTTVSQRLTSHLIRNVETGSTNILIQDVSFEFHTTGFRVTAQGSDHEKVNDVLQSTMSPQKFIPYD